MMLIIRYIKSILGQAIRVAYLYPTAYICIIGLVAIGLISLHVPSVSDYRSYILAKLAMICGLGYGLFATVTVFVRHHDIPTRYGIGMHVGVSIFLIVYYLYMPTNASDFVVRWGVQYALLLVASYIALFITPFIRQKFTHYSFWQFSIHVWRSLFVALLYTVVLGVGLSLALWAIDELFGVYIDTDRYATIWILIGGFVGMAMILSGIPRQIDFTQTTGVYPKFLALFVQYVLGGLSSLYVVILYIYVAKILVEGDRPINTVIVWIFTFAVIVIVATYVIFPYVLDEKDHPFTRKIISWGYSIYLPLSIVAYVAILQRVGDYGITEPRYMVLLLNAWFVAIALYFIMAKRPDFRYVIGSFVICILLSGVGPWSAFSISEYSQHRIARMRLGQVLLLDEQKKIRPLSTHDAQNVPLYDQNKIWDSMYYLIHTHGKQSVNVFLTGGVEDILGTGYTREYTSRMMEYMGFSGYVYGGYRYDSTEYISLYTQTDPLQAELIPIQGWRYMLPSISLYTWDSNASTHTLSGQNYLIVFDATLGILDVMVDQVREQMDIYKRLNTTKGIQQSKDGVPRADMMIEQGNIRIVFKYINGVRRPSFSIQSMEMDIFVK